MENDTPAPIGALQVDESKLKGHVDEMVRSSVEETLNALLEAEADQICGAERYERSPERVDTRAGHYERKLETKAGAVTLKMPKLRRLPFETAIIQRYRRKESSVEEALVEMYLAGVSVRRVEDITEALWGTRVSSGTVSRLNQKIYRHIEAWRNREIVGEFPYVYLDGVILKRSWGGEVKNVSVLVAIGVGADGYRQILGVAEGEKEDLEGWRGFLCHLKDRGLKGVRLIISDACRGLIEAVAEVYPKTDWQRCVVHFYRNVFSHAPNNKVAEVARMLKAIHAQEDRAAAAAKSKEVAARLKAMKLKSAADLVEQKASETLTYYQFPSNHWRQIRTDIQSDHTHRRTPWVSANHIPREPMGDTTTTDPRSRRNRASRRGGQLTTRARGSSFGTAYPPSWLPGAPVPDGRTIRRVGGDAKATVVIMPVNNPLERIIREIRRRTRVVGAFPDGHSALMLTAARLRHVASTKWGKRRYLSMDALLNPAKQEAAA